MLKQKSNLLAFFILMALLPSICFADFCPGESCGSDKCQANYALQRQKHFFTKFIESMDSAAKHKLIKQENTDFDSIVSQCQQKPKVSYEQLRLHFDHQYVLGTINYLVPKSGSNLFTQRSCVLVKARLRLDGAKDNKSAELKDSFKLALENLNSVCEKTSW